MAHKEKIKPGFEESYNQEKENELNLILHNDDVNSFDHVIESLIEVCEHENHQAEQCAFITHYKGKCDVKKGEFDKLSHMKHKLNSKGLTATID